MSNSPNAGFNLQVTGSNNGTWGTNLNSNFSIADGLYGGRVTVNCAGSSNITLTTSQAQNFFQILTGALTGNILYILPATGGQFFIINNTTGAYTVTVVNNASGTGIVVAQGGQQYVASDPDNTTVYGIIPSALSLASLSVSGQITSTQATGSAPFVVASTTPVANLSIGGNAATATNATIATTLATARTIAITGDLTYTSPSFDGSTNVTAAGTLATVNSNIGSYTNANITVNAKGQITAATNGSSGNTYPIYRQRTILSGTSYTVPSGVIAFYVFVTGSTGGQTLSSTVGIGGAGYSEAYYASPAGPYTYAIGAGGASTGGQGGTTSFDVLMVTGSGGAAGNGTGASGGIGSGGYFNATGGAGGNGTSSGDGGGGGGAGSRAGNGFAGANGSNSSSSGGGGGTGGAASGRTPGIAATNPSGSALVLPWGQNSETFQAGQVGLNGSSQPGGAGASGISTFNVIPAYGGSTSMGVNGGSNGSTGGVGVGNAGTIIIVEVLS